MVNPELGTKRTCPSCSTRFYDLNHNPIVCPHCGTAFIAATVLPSKSEMPAQAPKPRAAVAEDDGDIGGDVELVSLEDVEEAGDDEDDGVVIDDAAGGVEDETFLVVEEEPTGDMTDFLEGGAPKKKEDEEEA